MTSSRSARSHACLADGQETEKATVSQTCKRTEDDEEFLLIRLQMICVLMGGFAMISVRKQKAASASLFDQRKRQGRPTVAVKAKDSSRKLNDSDRNLTLELATLHEEPEENDDRDELAPLMGSKPLEII